MLVVENRAHSPRGHAPSRFAEVAAGFGALGLHVEGLTSRGWYFARDRTVPFPVHRYGLVAAAVDRVAERLGRMSLPSALRTWPRRVATIMRAVAMVGAARARRRRMPSSTAVVIVSDSNAVALIAAIAGPGRWLKYVFFPPTSPSTSWGVRLDDLVRRAAQRAERRRRADGGCCIVAAPASARRAEWADAVPGLEVVVAPVAGVGDARTIPDARRQLGLVGSDRIALLFGARYSAKDAGVVFQAFADHSDDVLAGWALVVMGGLATTAPASTCALTRPGFVDDRTRALAYSAADLVVLSFTKGFLPNSGTLMDAIAWGVPVVCSDGCSPADVVRDYRLGAIFEPGDAASLAAAVRAAPAAIDPVDLARARAELSNRAVARRALDALA